MRGTLWQRVRERTAAALASGALEPLTTTVEECTDEGVAFQLRVASTLARKEQTRGPSKDPFVPPYEPELVVEERLPPSHVGLLNKYPVFEHHLLVVTRAWEPQEALLTPGDCEALLTCLGEGAALGFYNAGRLAGASQGHKHLQLVPLPLGGAPGTPMEPLLRARALPFPHALADTPWDAAALHARYRELLGRVLPREGSAYNLLVTREWMLVVPRTAEAFEGVSINALGFAGSLFMKTPAQRDRLRAAGPMRALQAVTR